MKVATLINKMEYDVKIKVWDVNENETEPLYECISSGCPYELCERDVTGVYAGNLFIGIDTD